MRASLAEADMRSARLLAERRVEGGQRFAMPAEPRITDAGRVQHVGIARRKRTRPQGGWRAPCRRRATPPQCRADDARARRCFAIAGCRPPWVTTVPQGHRAPRLKA